MTRYSALPLLVVAILYGIVGPAPLSLGLCLAALIPLVWRGRLEWPRGTELLVSVPLFVVAIISIVTLFPQPHGALFELRTPWRAFAGAALLLAVMRLYLRAPLGGEPFTLALGIIALAACGGTARAEHYPGFVVAFVASAALARRAADPGRGPLAEAIRTRAASLAGIVAVAVVVFGTIVSLLPPLYRWAGEQIIRSASLPTTGFSDRMWLGSLRGMLESDARVLRIRGDASGALLRGIVFDEYAGARWSGPEGSKTILVPSRPEGPAIEIEIIASEPERYFLPRGAEAVAVSSGMARIDAMGVVTAIAAAPASRLWYRPGDRSDTIAPPGPRDVAVPEAIAEGLRPFASAFVADRTSVAQQLSALETALRQRHHYSLEVPWSGREDPIVAFVREGRGGHCEYFATAMALLARTLGIPARVVGGYRVSERNPIGGHYLVRERDAHAWVEAWVPGQGWTTFDPTPGIVGLEQSTPLFAAFWDAAGSGWLAFVEWLDARTPFEMVLAPIALIALALGLRAARRRSARTSVDPPPFFFARVCEALGRRGIERRASETPGRLAARAARALPPPIAAPCVRWLEDYAAYRYGGKGNEEELAQSSRELLRLLEDKEPRPWQRLVDPAE